MLMVATPADRALAAAISEAADEAVRAIPPVWPLASSVAVNPFLGQTGEPLPVTAARMRRAAGIRLTMPRSWYADKITVGEINDGDLQAALNANPEAGVASVQALHDAAKRSETTSTPLPTIADLAAKESGTDWPGIIAERVGHWAAGYFDAGQALWAMPHESDAYASWRSVASRDLTPEIAGLKGFAASVASTPSDANGAVLAAAEQLEIPAGALQPYFHRLLTTLGGWGQVGRYKLWQAELAGSTDQTATGLLAVRLVWEAALLRQYGGTIGARWRQVLQAYAEPIEPTADDRINGVLQEAAERAAQRKLAAKFAEHPEKQPELPSLQIAFCIDVRSEVIRRALESLDPSIQTLGFAGFFGLGTAHRRFASDVVETRLPVLLNPGVHSVSGAPTPEIAHADFARRIDARAHRAWGRFKLAAVSSFAFVETNGPVYIGKLLRDALGWMKSSAPNDPAPRFDPEPDAATRLTIADTVLRAMSLTEGFAPLVVLAGHGANVVNNPHASALHCGACGGYSGEVNARLLANLLNEPDVREGLRARGIDIPTHTLFLAALHDTTTDKITIYDGDVLGATDRSDLAQAREWIAAASLLARGERSIRLPRATGAADIEYRARDWSEVRPEWALAGCKAFIAAPRGRTAGLDLGGRAFLHDYQWQKDEGFGVLELILTAPVVVASWISLQYYGSTVAPEVFGGGNKLLHNVTGGIGVVEGNGGLLRPGLPWQSVHDGERYAHEPLRLSVVIEAPKDAINDVLSKHPGVRALFDNKWLHLFTLGDAGLAARYVRNLEWRDSSGE